MNQEPIILIPHTRHSAFSLIELLVALAVISMLTGIVLSALRIARDSSRITVCASNQRQLGMAVTAYWNDNDGASPPYLVDGPLVPQQWVTEDANCQFGAFWYHQPLLGQYIELKASGTTLSNTRQVATCPSAQVGNSASIGFNCAVFPHILTTGTWPIKFIHKWPSPLSLSVLMIDGKERFNAGFGSPPPTYGVNDSETGLDWSIGTPKSVYNWRKRHRGGANILLMDGHVEFCKDPRSEAQSSRKIFN